MAAETRQLAAWASRLSYADLPRHTVEATKRLFADWVFCAHAGASYRVISAMEAMASDVGGDLRGPASTFSGPPRAPYWAAYLNAGAGHVVEQDDLHNASVVHPATVVFPAAWAVAQAKGKSAREFIAASVVGYEVACRAGILLGREHYRVWHVTSTAGTLGAAAAAGRLLGLDTDGILNALGSAGTQTAGLWEFLATAADSKQVHCAHAAGTGVQSAFLALHGVTGSHNILLGKQGMFAGMVPGVDLSAADATRLLPTPGKFQIDDSSFKFHASCRHTHPSADGLLALMTKHNLSADDIAQVDCHVHQEALNVLTPAEAATSVHQSKFSMGFVLGVLANGRSAQLADFTDARLSDPAVRAFQKKVRMHLDKTVDAAFPAKWTARVVVTTTDGRVFEEDVQTPKGDPGNSLSDAEFLGKWQRLIDYADRNGTVDVKKLAKELLSLEEREDMNGLL